MYLSTSASFLPSSSCRNPFRFIEPQAQIERCMRRKSTPKTKRNKSPIWSYECKISSESESKRSIDLIQQMVRTAKDASENRETCPIRVLLGVHVSNTCRWNGYPAHCEDLLFHWVDCRSRRFHFFTCHLSIFLCGICGFVCLFRTWVETKFFECFVLRLVCCVVLLFSVVSFGFRLSEHGSLIAFTRLPLSWSAA